MLSVKDVFTFYTDKFKPLYSETEARDNIIPVEILFEIHASFDHLKRFYVDKEEELSCCRQARGHLKRAVLDMYKLKLKQFNSDFKSFQKNIQPSVLRIVDNGNFYPAMNQDRKEIIKIATEARKNESNKDKENAYANWSEVSVKINRFEENYFNCKGIDWAATVVKKMSFKKILANVVWTIIVGISCTCIGVVFESDIKRIFNKGSNTTYAIAGSPGKNDSTMTSPDQQPSMELPSKKAKSDTPTALAHQEKSKADPPTN